MSKKINPHPLRANVLHIAGALAVIFAAPAFAQTSASTNLPTVVVSAVTFVPSSQTEAGAAPPLRRQWR